MPEEAVSVVKPRKPWLRAFLMVAVVFLSGAVVGGVVTSTAMWRKSFDPMRRMPGFALERMVQDMHDELLLSPEQSQQLEQVVREHIDTMKTIHDEVEPRIQHEMDALSDRVASILNPEQEKRWRMRFEEMKNRWMPPGRGPGEPGPPPLPGFGPREPGMQGQPPQPGFGPREPGMQGQPPQPGFGPREPGMQGPPPQQGFGPREPGMQGQPPQPGFGPREPGMQGPPPQQGFGPREPGMQGQPPQPGFGPRGPGRQGPPPQQGLGPLPQGRRPVQPPMPGAGQPEMQPGPPPEEAPPAPPPQN